MERWTRKVNPNCKTKVVVFPNDFGNCGDYYNHLPRGDGSVIVTTIEDKEPKSELQYKPSDLLENKTSLWNELSKDYENELTSGNLTKDK